MDFQVQGKHFGTNREEIQLTLRDDRGNIISLQMELEEWTFADVSTFSGRIPTLSSLTPVFKEAVDGQA